MGNALMVLSRAFTRREKAVLVFLALVLVSATYYWLVQVPVSKSLTEISLAQKELEGQLLILEEKVQKQADMKAELEEILAQPSAAETPEYNNLEQVMVFLDLVLTPTTAYSLSFQQVSEPESIVAAQTEDMVLVEADAAQAVGHIVRRVIDMNVSCPSYDTAKTMVQNLRDSPYRCQISALSLSPGTVAHTIQAVTEPNQAQRSPDLTVGPVQVNLSIIFFETAS